MRRDYLTGKEAKNIKAMYPKGTRIELIDMDDPYTKLRCGDRGTVEFVDDAGQIHVRWDRGSSLALIPDVDSFSIVKEA